MTYPDTESDLLQNRYTIKEKIGTSSDDDIYVRKTQTRSFKRKLEIRFETKM